MGFTTLCVSMFCVYIATLENGMTDLDMRLDVLENRIRLGVRNFTHMTDMLIYNMKSKIEITMHTIVGNETQNALKNLDILARRAKEGGKDADTCHENFKAELLYNDINGFFELEPCLDQLEQEYKKLSKQLRIGRKNSKGLFESVEEVNFNCGKLGSTKVRRCIKRKLEIYTQKQELLEEELEEINGKYQHIVSLSSDAVKCIEEHKDGHNSKLQGILQHAAECMGVPLHV